MKLDDLKTGMIVTLRNGTSHIVMRDFIDEGDLFVNMSENKIIGWLYLNDYTTDMKYKDVDAFDVMRVYNARFYGISSKDALLWQREEDYKEVTMKEIEKNFGCKVKIVGNEDEHNNGWIPCSDRLPEDDDCRFYMCTVENHEDDPPMYCQYNEELGFGFYSVIYDPDTLGFIDTEFKTNSKLGYEKVITWMPLPEPYKESE